MLRRATEMLESENRTPAGSAQLVLALTGGPLQNVLRPSQLEAAELQEGLQQIALFGETAILTTREGIEIEIWGDKLVFIQADRLLSISETGSLHFVRSIPPASIGLPVIIEEEVRDIIHRFLRFSNAVLTHIDPLNRLSHVVVAAKILDVGHLAWRTRAEHAESPNSVRMNTFLNDEDETVHLSPPHRTRSALRLNTSELAVDLVARLRRLFQNPGRNRW